MKTEAAKRLFKGCFKRNIVNVLSISLLRANKNAVREPSNGVDAWSWKRDLNTRPAHYECAALPTELFQHYYNIIL